MSGQPNQPPRGWNRGGPPSPIHYRPPSPWAPSPPPIISGPRHPLNYPAPPGSPMMNSSAAGGGISPSNRSTPMMQSPMFGQSATQQRGTRGPQMPCPRPRWPGPSPNRQSPAPYNPVPEQMYYNQQQQRVSPSPATIGANGPKPYQRQTYSPVPQSSYSRASPVVVMNQGPPPEYMYSAAPQYEYVGVPLEPPQPKTYIIYDEEEEQGPSTAEIIANQSQDYVDERLAEYQMTIFQLQGKFYLNFTVPISSLRLKL